MLVQQVPPLEIQEIECKSIKTFHSLKDAKAYAATKNGTSDIFFETNQPNTWYVLPKIDKVFTGACYGED